ncbi:DnaA N-terminal domain-containing protein [Pseudooceanicola nanhaiensis]|jgi:hypothetical protein|uniref:DnaA N-terminal domain-containing protein n=1 Tax=Pseudooceanicola nanhaiensis TaxID=375761 RepID=UPI003517E63C
MQKPKAVGPQAGARKYDILSALMAFALSQDKIVQRRVMRIMALITARYNWQRDELCVGQREIARMWSVDERTVKREMAVLRGLGWLVQKRKGARGRLSVYGIDLERMMEDTRPAWPLIGPDFVERVGGRPEAPESNVVPLRGPVPMAGEGVWATAQARLHAEDPVTYGAWFHGLSEVEAGQGRLVLAAPSAFHATYVRTHFLTRLTSLARRIDPTLGEVRIEH